MERCHRPTQTHAAIAPRLRKKRLGPNASRGRACPTPSASLRWQYSKNYTGEAGYDCGWVDSFQWTGDTEPPASDEWETTTYVYDPAGRRIAKAFDGEVAVRYVYDGGHCIAEYDVNDALLRKFLYGPGVDQPICMIEVQDANAVYYYHFDGLGSVVALSDADSDTVQTYEYSVYGQPAASDPNHPNPFLFTGRRFDPETGLYHYRARAYNPYIGRFLQTDPAGQGMNAYAYCGNNATNCVDPTGCYFSFLESTHSKHDKKKLVTFAWTDPQTHEVTVIESFNNLDAWVKWAKDDPTFGGFDDSELSSRPGYKLSVVNKKSDSDIFWALQCLRYLGGDGLISRIEQFSSVTIVKQTFWNQQYGYNWYDPAEKKVHWYMDWDELTRDGTEEVGADYTVFLWNHTDALAMLYHELSHVDDDYNPCMGCRPDNRFEKEVRAVCRENEIRYALYMRAGMKIHPRPGYTLDWPDLAKDVGDAWYKYWNGWGVRY